jgi:hypothetical protein
MIFRRPLQRRAPVIIIQADNVILAEVVTELDLNEYERNIASVLDPMGRAERDIDGISSPHFDAVAVKGDDSLSANHEPMLGTA